VTHSLKYRKHPFVLTALVSLLAGFLLNQVWHLSLCLTNRLLACYRTKTEVVFCTLALYGNPKGPIVKPNFCSAESLGFSLGPFNLTKCNWS